MALSIEEFHEDLFQDIVLRGEAVGSLKEDSFFEKVTELLVEAGEIETADRAAYIAPRGLRVDGYGGDPGETEGVLSLLVSDFNQDAAIVSLTATEMDAALKRTFNFLRKALDPRFRDALEETSSAYGLADLIAARWSVIRKVRIILLSNKVLSERVTGKEHDRMDERLVMYEVWDLGRLHRYVSSGQAREPIEIDLQNDFGGPIRVLPAHMPDNEYEAYLAVIPGEQLAAIYDRWGPRLLEQNVRVFLQARSKVNKGIKATLDNEPAMFFAYNNGITATATSVVTANSDDGVVITRLRDLQIVNGGQTTASVHEGSRRKGCDMSNVFVQMKLSIIDPARSMDVVPRISEYANSQNKVNAADFFANHPFHIRMEGFSRRIHAPAAEGVFRQSKWFYERARGQYQDARGGLTPAQRKKFDLEYPKKQMFSKTDLAKYMMVWEEKPHVVSAGAQKNFSAFVALIGSKWKGDAVEFNDRYFHHTVAKAILFRRTEQLVSQQDWYSGGYRANIVAYTLAKMSHDAREQGKVVDFDRVWRQQAASHAMDKAITIAAKKAIGVITQTPQGISNVTEWAKKPGCWERFAEVPVNWPQSWLDELLTPGQERREKQIARKERKEWNEIEAQTAVFSQGSDFWREVKKWGHDRRLLSPDEFSVLTVAESMPKRVPSGRQSVWAISILERLQCDGCPLTLEA